MWRVVVAAVLALAVTACVRGGEPAPLGPPDPGGVVDAVTPEPTAPQLARPDTTPEDCPEDLPEDARCGFVILPEDRTDPAGPVIEMAWVRLPAVEVSGDAVPASTPLVVLPDGPGQSGIADVEAWVDSPLREGRELLLIDPRGTGRSFPSLDCGQPPRPGALPLDLVEDCLRTLMAQGVALDAYDTAAIAADVVDLTDALGFTTVDLLGIGHGAKVALTVMDTDPRRVRSMVLDSPIPHEADPLAQRPAMAQAVLNRLLDECVLQPRCRDVGAGLQQALDQLVTRLDQAPVVASGGTEVSGEDLVVAVMGALRGADGPGLVPAALELALEGEPEAALEILQEAAVAGAAVPRSTFSEGLRLSADCRDEAPFTAASPDEEPHGGLGAVGRAVATDVAELLLACTTWSVGTSGPAADDPVNGAVPTLVLTGEFDPLSPPAWGAAIAARMDTATVVQVGGAGHRVVDADDCTLDLVAAFLAAPRAPVDGTCAAERTVTFDLAP